MKKILAVIFGTIIVVVGVIAFNQPSKANANISSLALRQLVGTEGATTSPAYFTTSTATTSYAFFSERADSLELHLALTASTSATQLQYTIEHSDDNVDWYGEDTNSTASGATTHFAISPVHIWAPANLAASTTRRTFKFPSLGARFTRFNFHVNTQNAGLWATVVTKEQIQ